MKERDKRKSQNLVGANLPSDGAYKTYLIKAKSKESTPQVSRENHNRGNISFVIRIVVRKCVKEANDVKEHQVGGNGGIGGSMFTF